MSGDLARPNKHAAVRTYARTTHPAILAMDGFRLLATAVSSPAALYALK
jgi:hypothetical protein